MIEILYIHSDRNNYRTDFFDRLNRVVQSLPDDVFYREDVMPEDLNKEFNAVIVAELKREFKDSLNDTETRIIQNLDPYNLEVLIALICVKNNIRYACMFVPYRESVLIGEYNGVPIEYMVERINERIKLSLIWGEIADLYTIGYIDPSESAGRF